MVEFICLPETFVHKDVNELEHEDYYSYEECE